MSDQGLPQITNSELIADLEAILLELRDRSTTTSRWAPTTSSLDRGGYTPAAVGAS